MSVMRNVASAENKLRVICVGTGRDGTQSCTHMLRHLFGEEAPERVMHEFRAPDFYNLHSAYCETGSSQPLSKLKRIIADCPHECIVGNGYAAVLPLFAQRYGRDLTLV